MAQISAVLFDKDGTLFDFDATWSEWAASMIKDLADHDAATETALAEILGYDLHTRQFYPWSSVIAGTAAEQAEAVSPALPHLTTQIILERMNASAETAQQVEVTPLQPFVTRLRKDGFRLGVMTNDAEASARAHLAKAGVEAAFDFVAGFDSGFGAKPDPAPLLAFAEALQLAPAQIVMVGDSTHDLKAARAAGMISVGVLTGPADAETLAPYADSVLPSIAELPDCLFKTQQMRP